MSNWNRFNQKNNEVPCWSCGELPSRGKRPIGYNTMLLEQTPKSIWDEYKENSYTILEAIDSELSYAD